ncbi:MAG TPA: kelch repeat-containing protein [Bacteroidales bacterium]|jgi:N-acetylneuraminic acid mutarotase|nr:kelch repeat-containing protein [Bacteroidales bacterium]HPI30691.1 kelch repeat-containing protein [Bacteroidales bacterium]
MIYKKIFMLAFGTLFFYHVHGQGLWTQKADIPTSGRVDAASFSIGTKGYFACGFDTNGRLTNDFWEWDQITNTWVQKASLPGLPRRRHVAFSIGTKGYVCVGIDSTHNFTNEVWEWDQTTNTWSQKSDFAGPCRDLAVGFSIGSKGYLGTGGGCSGNQTKDFWEYDPATDTWTQKADYGGPARYDAQGFSIGNKGYIGGGISDTGPPFLQIDFWEYDPDSNTWTQKANLPEYRCNAAGFSIGNSGYFCAGVNDISQLNDLIEWDQSKNIWTHKASLTAQVRVVPIGFSIGNKGYVGMGVSAQSLLNDFWEYTPEGDGIKELINEGAINVYPNPAENNINVEIKGLTGDLCKFTLRNLLGSKLLEKDVKTDGSSLSINIEKLNNGLYIYEVLNADGINIKSGRLVISK